ncbi:lipoyl(octanoyl) transferase LipB [Steroidobacter sp. S1-65]|uniref:Octanoyltransferase n=1 Tax=Steroidobacter gossypii TaxID=2805490 RepID=A0ABS1X5H7_9GAMM|nr:lipoyl(octanoyl) transferase LipB [Steroidobacter gossypii]MBM0108482.1 lipoyl(octanoyl) transferase LipB [Steroidobacter gossypii]
MANSTAAVTTASTSSAAEPVIRWLGRVEYEPTWRAMQTFTNERDASTPDEIWFLEHPPVFTLGMNAAPEHLLAPGDIPVVQIDRGGQVTYHGPGQLVVYPLLDVRRAGLGVRQMVMALENAIIDLLASWNIAAVAKREAPGVYVNDRKVASIGLRIRRGSSYHGLAFNVAMDLQPFQRINPCGYRGLEVIDLRSLGVNASVQEVADALSPRLLASLRLTPAVG